MASVESDKRPRPRSTTTAAPPPASSWRPDRRDLAVAVLHGWLAYAAAWVTAAALILLVLVALPGLPDSTALAHVLPEQIRDGVRTADAGTVLAAVLLWPAQLVGSGFLGALQLDTPSVPTRTIGWVPLTVTCAAFLVAALVSSRSQRRAPRSPRAGAARAGGAGATAAVLTWTLAAWTGTDVQAGGTDLPVTLSSGAPVLGAFLVVTAGALTGALAPLRHGPEVPAAVRVPVAALRIFCLHLLLVSGLAAGALLVAAGIGLGPAALLAAPAWLPTLAGQAYSAVHLAPLRVVEGDDVVLLTVLDLPWWAWTASLVVLLLCTLAAALAWGVRLRTLPSASAVLFWFALPGVFLVGGAVLTGLTRVSGSAVGLTGADGVHSVSYGPVPWTCLVLAGWALVVTVLSRTVVPPVLAAWPVLAGSSLLGGRGSGRTSGREDAVVPPGAAASGAAPEAAPDPASHRRTKVLVAAGAAFVALSIAAVVTVNLVNERVYGPDQDVRAYLDALVAGDADSSRELLPSTVDEGQDPLLSDAVYGAAARRISGYEILAVSRTEDGARVDVEIRQDGTTAPLEFALTRTGSTGVFFDEWHLDGPELLEDVSVLLPVQVPQLTVNGVEVALPAGDTDRYKGMRAVTLPALPGEYAIDVPPASTYLSYGVGQDVLVPADPTGAPRGALFLATPTPAVEAEVVGRVRAALDTCLASTSAAPPGCPNQALLFGSPERLRGTAWALTTEPTFTLAESYAPGRYTLVSDDAVATFSYERNAEFDAGSAPRWEREEDTVPLHLRATVVVEPESIDVQLDLG